MQKKTLIQFFLLLILLTIITFTFFFYFYKKENIKETNFQKKILKLKLIMKLEL